MSDPARPLPEIKATAHLMLFEPGTYCVFHTPGTEPPDAASGLPGVRVSPAPGLEAGRVELAGFNADGWLGSVGDASLVRVSGGPTRVLFTIYQVAESAHEPPKLQIMRLTRPAAAPAPALAPVSAEVVAHQYGSGDIGGRFGDWVGARGSRRWLEGFALAPTGLAAADIEYQAVLGRGWLSPWSEGGQFCGSRGMSLPILGLRARLRGTAAETHTLSVAATFVDGSTAGPVTDGGVCEAESLAALEAFQVSIAPKEAPAKRARRAKR